MTLTRYRLGDLIEQVNTKNNDADNKYGKESVRGISNSKEFMLTKANLDNRKLDNFLIVPNNHFVFNRRTTRMGEKFAIAYNDTSNTYIVTNDYVVFKVISEEILSSNFLFIYFNRPEFDRYVRWESWGSATEMFKWEQMCDVNIDLPPLDIQKKYVAIYKAMLENQAAYEKGLEDFKLTCDATIEDIRRKYKQEKIENYISKSVNKNKDDKIKKVYGLSTKKEFRVPQSRVNKKNLTNYKIVKPKDIAFVPTTDTWKVLAFAINNFNENIVVSPIYEVFSTKLDSLNPEYLALWLSRDEFDRYARYNSWGSARETFSWEEMCRVKIPIPPIEVQNSIANIYKVYTERKEINEKLKERLKNICPILIKGAVEEARRKEA